MTHQLELPDDSALENVIAGLGTESMLAICQEQLDGVDAAVRREWKQCRVVEALYHPGRYIRVAYAFLSDPSIPDHRTWPRSDIVYVNAPVRTPMSRRGSLLKLGGAELEAYRFPNDRRLRGLRKFTAQESALATWQGWIDQSGKQERLAPKTLQRFLLRYVPEQKWVVRLRAELQERGSGKTHKRRIAVRCADTTSCASLLQRHAALRRASKESGARFHAPRVIGHDAQLGMLAVKWAQGRNLFELLQEGPTAEVMDTVVTMIRSFHESSVSGLPGVVTSDVQQWVAETVADLAATCGDLRSSIEELGRTIHDRLDRLDGCDVVTLHNDLHWNQMRVDGDRFTFLDLERMAVGDPLIDVANLATQVRMLGHRGEFLVDAATASAWAAEFIGRWEHQTGRRIDTGRFRCYTALSLLSLARGMMRHLRVGWRKLADRCIEMASDELNAANREAIVP